MKNNVILIVDDQPISREKLAWVFAGDEQYEILQAGGGEEAMQMIREHHDRLAVILLDIVMPEKDGYDVLQYMRFTGYKENIPVIMISGAGADDSETRALKMGGDDFISKDAYVERGDGTMEKRFNADVVRQRVGNMIQLYAFKQQLEAERAKFCEVSRSSVKALLAVLEAADPEGSRRRKHIQQYVYRILEYVQSFSDSYRLPPEELERISVLSALHDIGRISVPVSIIRKLPILSPEEAAIYEAHTEKGCDIIRAMANTENRELVKTALEICKWHHERWDGSGYPDHLMGDDIPVSAQVTGLADTYESLRAGTLTGRVFSHEDAMVALETGEFGAFSPLFIETCKLISDDLRAIHDEDAVPAAERINADDYPQRRPVRRQNAV